MFQTKTYALSFGVIGIQIRLRRNFIAWRRTKSISHFDILSEWTSIVWQRSLTLIRLFLYYPPDVDITRSTRLRLGTVCFRINYNTPQDLVLFIKDYKVDCSRESHYYYNIHIMLCIHLHRIIARSTRAFWHCRVVFFRFLMNNNSQITFLIYVVFTLTNFIEKVVNNFFSVIVVFVVLPSPVYAITPWKKIKRPIALYGIWPLTCDFTVVQSCYFTVENIRCPKLVNLDRKEYLM